MGIHHDNKTLEKTKEKIFDHDKIESIKSLYITKIIFSFLSDNVKLNLIKFNKKYQNKLGINIEYFEKLYGKYEIKIKNGIGRIYSLDKNRLIFEGEYSNGLKNGKGKEYYDTGKLKFTGEYINGNKIKGKGYDYQGNIILEIKRNGKGKEYYSDGKLKFEGQYINGKRWNGKVFNHKSNKGFLIKEGKGNGKEYNFWDRLEFEGEYLNGKRWKGKVKGYYYDSDKIKFEGEYLNGKKYGKWKK